jgi:hypothetical protein
MTQHSQRIRRLVVVTFVLAALSAGTGLALVDTRPVSVKAAEWAEAALNRGDLPTRLNDYLKLPMEYRKAVFNVMTPVQKHDLWRSHLETLLIESQLTVEQTRLLTEYITAMSPDLYGASGSEAERVAEDRLKPLCQVASSVFPDALRKQLKQIRRETAPAAESFVMAWFRRVEIAIGPVLANAGSNYVADCDCTPSLCGSDCEEKSLPPVCADETGCTKPAVNDCGCFQAYECVDKCVPIPSSLVER